MILNKVVIVTKDEFCERLDLDEGQRRMIDAAHEFLKIDAVRNRLKEFDRNDN
jgi:hypothetical protein